MRAQLGVIVLLGMLGTASCTSSPQKSQSIGMAAGTYSDYTAALNAVLDAMRRGKNPITLRVKGNGQQVAERLTQDSVKYAMVTKVKTMAIGDYIALHPSYVDDTLLLAVHRGDLPESALSSSQRAALHKVQGVVRGIMRQHSGQYERALALHDYILRTCRYDTSMKNWNHATVTVDLINTHRSVCDGYTRLYHILLSIAGIENCIVVGSSGKDVSHSWNMAKLEGKWTHIDCTYDDPVPDEPGRTMRHYFGMSDAMIARNHSWNRAAYPTADSSAMYYPTTRGLRFETMEEFLHYCRSYAAAGNKSITAYVQELANSGANAKALLEQTQLRLRMNVVARLQVDTATPGVLYCYFR